MNVIKISKGGKYHLLKAKIQQIGISVRNSDSHHMTESQISSQGFKKKNLSAESVSTKVLRQECAFYSQGTERKNVA